MAQTITILPELVTSDSPAADEILTISDLISPKLKYPIALIEIVSGTWRFGAGEIASNSSATFTAGDKVDIQLRPSSRGRPQLKLNIKAANGGEAFRISIIGR